MPSISKVGGDKEENKKESPKKKAKR